MYECIYYSVWGLSVNIYLPAQDTANAIVMYIVMLHAGRLRVNMGNIYFEQKKYPQAVKMYRMALDQIQNVHKDVRYDVNIPYKNKYWRGTKFGESMKWPNLNLANIFSIAFHL